jgi:hypothetical protein
MEGRGGGEAQGVTDPQKGSFYLKKQWIYYNDNQQNADECLPIK